MKNQNSLLFPPVPVFGESLIGLVSRAANDNRHQTVAPILAAAGYPHHAHYDLTVSRAELLPNLAQVLGIAENEVTGRAHAEIATPFRSVQVDFMGAPVMRSDLDYRARRLAPLSLSQAPHHRAIWTHRLVPWCTETGALLIEVCPYCNDKFRWQRAEGSASCDRCASDLRDYDSGKADPALRALVDPVLDLLSPDPARHQPALARLHPDIQAIGRGAAFELGWALACAFGAPAGAVPRARQSKLPAEKHIKTLVESARLLADWPECVEKKLRVIGQEADADSLEKTVRRLRADFRPRRSWPELSALVTNSLPDIFAWPLRVRSVVHSFAPSPD